MQLSSYILILVFFLTSLSKYAQTNNKERNFGFEAGTIIPINYFGPVNFSLILEFIVLISAWFILVKSEKRILPSKINKRTLIFCVLIGICVALGSLFSNIALSEVSVLTNVLTSLIFEAIVILIGLYHLGEKINYRDWLLIFGITLASIMIMI